MNLQQPPVKRRRLSLSEMTGLYPAALQTPRLIPTQIGNSMQIQNRNQISPLLSQLQIPHSHLPPPPAPNDRQDSQVFMLYLAHAAHAAQPQPQPPRPMPSMAMLSPIVPAPIARRPRDNIVRLSPSSGTPITTTQRSISQPISQTSTLTPTQTPWAIDTMQHEMYCIPAAVLEAVKQKEMVWPSRVSAPHKFYI